MVFANLLYQAALSLGGHQGKQVAGALSLHSQLCIKWLDFHLFYIMGLDKLSLEMRVLLADNDKIKRSENDCQRECRGERFCNLNLGQIVTKADFVWVNYSLAREDTAPEFWQSAGLARRDRMARQRQGRLDAQLALGLPMEGSPGLKQPSLAPSSSHPLSAGTA